MKRMYVREYLLWSKFLRKNVCCSFYLRELIFADRWKNRKKSEKLEPAKMSCNTVGCALHLSPFDVFDDAEINKKEITCGNNIEKSLCNLTIFLKKVPFSVATFALKQITDPLNTNYPKK